MERKQKLIIRWSIVTAGLIALFWAIWYLATGEVPIVTSIKMTENWTYILPFSISRWWDILIGPIWSTIIIFLLTSKKLKGNKNLVAALGITVVAGLGFGLVGLVFGLGFGLIAALGIGLVFGLVFGQVIGLVFGLVFGLGLGLGLGLVSGLGLGLGFGLGFGLGAGLITLLNKTIS